jgi:DNA-binding MarR family transcriptional regulator
LNSESQQKELEQMAGEIFELTKLSWLARHRTKDKKKGRIDLTETEFLALDFLVKTEPMTVGRLQRSLNVLPAQMSRVIRSLESKTNKPLIRCQINAQDKRRVDVYLSDAGRKARDEYLGARLETSVRIMSQLSERDRREFMRILSQIHDLVAQSMES